MWANVTNGTKPGERMMGQLERRAESISGEFNSQSVANTLWEYVTMGTKPGERMMGQLERWSETISGEFNSQDVANMSVGCTTCVSMSRAAQGLRQGGQWSSTGPLIF